MTTQLYLTSSIGTPGVAKDIRKKIGGSKPLKTAFIITPVEVEDTTDDDWLDLDKKGLTDNGFEIFDYTITGKSLDQIRTDLDGIDALYISGGNTNYLLQESQKSNFIQFVRDFVESGKPYISTSAGSIIAGPMITPYLWEDDRGAPNLRDFTAYNLVNFSVIPHWGSKDFKDSYLNGRMEQIYLLEQAYILLTDSQYVEVHDDWHRVIDITK